MNPRPERKRRRSPPEDETLYRMQAEICRALAHPRRLQILDLLAGGERSTVELLEELGVSKVNLSQHLSVMSRAGIVVTRRQGREAFHRLAFSEIKEACRLTRSVLVLRLRQTSELAKALEFSGESPTSLKES